MTSIARTLFYITMVTIISCNNTSAAAPVCTKWDTLVEQSRNRFYSVDAVYGRLGIKYGYRGVYLIEKNGCYDLSGSDLNNLSFFFNNAIEDDAQSEPVFLGVEAIKTYAYKMQGYEMPVVAAFYRNGNELDTSGDWALPNRPIADIARWSPVVESEIVRQSDRYEPEDRPVASLDAIYSLIATSDDAVIRAWHALLVTRDTGGGNKAVVARNSYETRNLWKLDVDKVNLVDGGIAIARNYLIKYRDSSSPTRKVFFTVENLAAAECLYIKLIRPGRDGPLLGISDKSGEFVIFRLNQTARC